MPIICVMLKAMGFSDMFALAKLDGVTDPPMYCQRVARQELAVHPVYKRIDTCAAEFASPTAYMYSSL